MTLFCRFPRCFRILHETEYCPEHAEQGITEEEKLQSEEEPILNFYNPTIAKLHEAKFACISCDIYQNKPGKCAHGPLTPAKTLIKDAERNKREDFKKLSKKLKEIVKKTKMRNKDEKQERIETKFTSFFEHDGALYEEIYDGTVARFAVWRNKEYLGAIPHLELPGKIFAPIKGEVITQGLVSLPSSPQPYDSEEKLAIEIQAFIHRYCDVSPEFEEISTNYAMLSWVYDRFNTLPYLRVLGDTGCGKSRFETVMAAIVYKGMKVSGAVTPAPIYRLLKQWNGTLIIDEADFRQSDEKNEVVTILNCGFEKNSPVIRCEKNNPDEIQVFPAFGPKIIATRRSFADKALEARCLTEVMQQTSRKDIPPILPQRFYAEAQELRNKLLTFRFRTLNGIDPDSALKVELGDVEPRLKQATASFAVLFANIPGLDERFRTFLRNYNETLIEERSQSLEGEVVGAICELLQEGELNILSQDLCNKIGEKDLKPRKVGSILKSLGLKTHAERRVLQEGGKGMQGRWLVLEEKRLTNLVQRYLPSPIRTVAMGAIVSQLAKSATIATVETVATGVCEGKSEKNDFEILPPIKPMEEAKEGDNP